MAILIKIALCAQYALKMQSRIRSHWSTRSLKTPRTLRQSSISTRVYDTCQLQEINKDNAFQILTRILMLHSQ
jgi:hypothetical protein